MKRRYFSTPLLRMLLLTGSLLPFASCNQTTEPAAVEETPTEVAADTTMQEEGTMQIAEEAEDSIQLRPLAYEEVVDSLTAYGKENPEAHAIISTRFGDMKVHLFKDTPLHRANFVRLSKAGFYDQGEFYRVIEGFVIQGGDSDERTAKQGAYKIPQEFNRKYYHKKGALAASRFGDARNPEKESSSHNFYIVHGKPHEDYVLDIYEKEHNMKYTPEQRRIYKTIGGAPNLDTEYTVFGEVVEGLNIIDSIANEPVDRQDWPLEIVPHKIKVY
ncbi:peptidylprolyl isomerase [Pontibacter silvestris]|uniref:peptidylprolyl isomerase n=1 Tax=Pontibacter silvestris TaxID=2305183 RepID=A0ABW4WRM7_9BACT|nr:peptidylprolyl isomerase [Pontibacter silvestris]MCC9138186.1 peptidylprolyl isomerase [Pontibacter silvestris]